MKEQTKKFGKYIATFTPGNEEFPPNCYIENKTQHKSYTASLAVAMDYGELEASDGTAVKIEQAVLDDIEQWAVENGY